MEGLYLRFANKEEGTARGVLTQQFNSNDALSLQDMC